MHGGASTTWTASTGHEQKAYVRPVDVDYYTDANLAVDLKVLEVARASAPSGARAGAYGDVAVTYLATIFKKIKLDTHENVGWGKIHLPQDDMHTTSYWLALPTSATDGDEPRRRSRPASGAWRTCSRASRRCS